MQGANVNASTQASLTIGELAERTGCTVPTIRYYEEIGLIPAAKRRSSGHRFYDATYQELLLFIRRGRDFGFSIEQVRELVALSQTDQRNCFETLEITRAHLQAVRAKLAELRALESSLARFAASCEATCAGGPAAKCTILKEPDVSSTAPKGGCCQGGVVSHNPGQTAASAP
jgi:MerR family copper efflux transcriptional regulator